jgi:hypothetical protein
LTNSNIRRPYTPPPAFPGLKYGILRAFIGRNVQNYASFYTAVKLFIKLKYGQVCWFVDHGLFWSPFWVHVRAGYSLSFTDDLAGLPNTNVLWVEHPNFKGRTLPGIDTVRWDEDMSSSYSHPATERGYVGPPGIHSNLKKVKLKVLSIGKDLADSVIP